MAHKKTLTCDGNQAAAPRGLCSAKWLLFIYHAVFYDGEIACEWAAQGRKNIFRRKSTSRGDAKSEAGAGAVHGSLQGGCLDIYGFSRLLLICTPK